MSRTFPTSGGSTWRRDWLADDAVYREPVSAPNSLLTGKNTGNFGGENREVVAQNREVNSIPKYQAVRRAIRYPRARCSICWNEVSSRPTDDIASASSTQKEKHQPERRHGQSAAEKSLFDRGTAPRDRHPRGVQPRQADDESCRNRGRGAVAEDHGVSCSE